MLRQATGETHLRMHRLWPFVAIDDRKLMPVGYACLLRSLFLFYSAISIAADRAGWGKVSSSARRLELLAADLDYLCVAIPPTIPEWSLGGPESTLGAIYVGEGSMLGGKLIARKLDYLLGAGDDGRRFFIGHPDTDSLQWRKVVGVVEETLAGECARRQAIEGALAAFDLFQACVTRPASLARLG